MTKKNTANAVGELETLGVMSKALEHSLPVHVAVRRGGEGNEETIEDSALASKYGAGITSALATSMAFFA